MIKHILFNKLNNMNINNVSKDHVQWRKGPGSTQRLEEAAEAVALLYYTTLYYNINILYYNIL